MPQDPVRRFGTLLLAANATIAFLSLTNLILVAAGAIDVRLPDAKDLAYSYDAANRTLIVGTSFTVRNEGIYSVHDLDIGSRLLAPWGDTILDFSRRGMVIGAGEVRSFPIVLMLPVGPLIGTSALRLLTEDGTFELSVKVRALYTMGLTQFRSDDVERYEWRAPLLHMGELLSDGSLARAAERALEWAGPMARERISSAILDSALADGQWRYTDLAGLAVLGCRLAIDEGAGTGTFEVRLQGTVAGSEWSIGGSVPLRLVDGQLHLAQEVAPHGG